VILGDDFWEGKLETLQNGVNACSAGESSYFWLTQFLFFLPCSLQCVFQALLLSFPIIAKEVVMVEERGSVILRTVPVLLCFGFLIRAQVLFTSRYPASWHWKASKTFPVCERSPRPARCTLQTARAVRAAPLSARALPSALCCSLFGG